MAPIKQIIRIVTSAGEQVTPKMLKQLTGRNLRPVNRQVANMAKAVKKAKYKPVPDAVSAPFLSRGQTRALREAKEAGRFDGLMSFERKQLMEEITGVKNSTFRDSEDYIRNFDMEF